MARVQDGDLSMSTSDADGTTLTLSLSAVPESEALPATRPEVDADGVETSAGIDDLPAIRVLVVDDDEYNRLVIRRYLPIPPLTVETAVNGRAALDAALAEAFDMIFIDIDMPVMDGLEATARIRAHERATGRSQCVIVALSSHDDEETKQRSREAGSDAYLVKPVPRATLRRTLADLARASLKAPASRVATSAAPGDDSASAVGSSAAAGRESAPAVGPSPADVVELDPDLKDTLPSFLDSRREMLDDLERALDKGAREDARRLAHRLAGSFGLYGFRWASDQSRRIERDAENGDAGLLLEWLIGLRRHLDTVDVRVADATVTDDARQ
jgi:CheY-like chemotaxis protein/HPt (histidine-containing phosphotransfer) domain-containing protein